jgi:hypothetical protein
MLPSGLAGPRRLFIVQIPFEVGFEHLFHFVGHVVIEGFAHFAYHFPHLGGALGFALGLKPIRKLIDSLIFGSITGDPADELSDIGVAAFGAAFVARIRRHAHERRESLLAGLTFEVVDRHVAVIPSLERLEPA